MECFTAGFLEFFTKKFQNLAFGWTTGYSPSDPSISGIFWKFPNFLRSYVVRQLVRQLVHWLSGYNNLVPFHLWWRQSLLKSEKVCGYFVQDCRIIPTRKISTYKIPTQENSHPENSHQENSHPRKEKPPLLGRFLPDDSNPSSNFDSRIFSPKNSQLLTNNCSQKCQNQRSLSMYAKHDNFFKHNF